MPIRRCGLPQGGIGLLSVFRVFERKFIFGPFVNANLALVGVGCVFDPADRIGLESLPLFDQFLDAFRIHVDSARQSLKVTRLPGRTRAQASLCQPLIRFEKTGAKG